jgi:sterol carrier protein 2
MSRTFQTLVAGVGMIPFTKPGASAPYDEMGSEAVRLALADAGIAYAAIEQAYAGYVYGDSCAGQRVLYQAGLTGIPIVNVNNNCATGSTALFLGAQAIDSGAADCVLVVGFEEMRPGALGAVFEDRVHPLARFDTVCDDLVGRDLPLTLRYFCGAGRDYMARYGATLADFAAIRAKASRHAARNPLSLFRKELTVDEILAAPPIWEGIMTRPMACPPTCGAAAAVLVSPAFARRHGLSAQVRIAAQAMTTDTPQVFEGGDMIQLVGAPLTRAAATAVYELAGIGPDAIGVVELHDCFAQNEMLSYEALGLCGEGEGPRFVADGDNSYGGKIVTNPSGGLLSKGHPLGATGLAQCYELTHQLRGIAGDRQVEGVAYALQHNLGLGDACVVTLYERC